MHMDLFLLRYVLVEQEYLELSHLWQDNFPVRKEEFGTWQLLWVIIPITSIPHLFSNRTFILFTLLSLDRCFRESDLCSSFQLNLTSNWLDKGKLFKFRGNEI